MPDDEQGGFLVPPDIADQLWESMKSGKIIYGPTFTLVAIPMSKRQRIAYAWRTFRRCYQIHKLRFIRETLHITWLALKLETRHEIRSR